MHKKARYEQAPGYPKRFPVPDSLVEWDISYPDYKPPYFVDQTVLDNDETKKTGGWANPEDFEYVKQNRSFSSYLGEVKVDKQGVPLNPKGRTGIIGRGLLGKWGTNFAADPIITRRNQQTGQLEMITILRKDVSQWAIPGGMVEKGDSVSRTLLKELSQEANAQLDMSDAFEVYRGYVDDPRNTDNAWIETSAMHKHLSAAQAAKIELKAGDDAKDVKWLELTESALNHLYASHEDLVRKAISRLL